MWLHCGFFFFQAEDGIRDLVRSRGLGDVYKRQNEYRSKVVDEEALRKLMHKFQIAMDIDDADVGSEDFLVRLMTRVTYEQFPYQESMFEELARSHAWMVEGLPDVETRVITEDSLAAMLDGRPVSYTHLTLPTSDLG